MGSKSAADTRRPSIWGWGFLLMYLGQSSMLFVLQPWSLLILPFSLKLFRRYNRWLQGLWSHNLVLITQWFAHAPIHVTGDEIRADDNCIVMANHQLYADWWYLWHLAHKHERHQDVKIILKHAWFKHAPVFGWGMQFFEFIFLRRSWKHDEHVLKNKLRSYKDGQIPLWLFIFPEGTTKSELAISASKRYAMKQRLKEYKHLLLPRITGSLTCFRELGSQVNACYDVTFGYPDVPEGIMPENFHTMKRIFLQTEPPRHICAHVQRYEIKDIPQDEVGFENWLAGVFSHKDQLLEHYHKHGHFPGKPRNGERKASITPFLPVYILVALILYIIQAVTFRSWGYLINSS